MLSKKEHIGIAVDGKSLRLVSAVVSGQKIVLDRFDTLDLVNPIEESLSGSDETKNRGEEEEGDEIFGIDDAISEDDDSEEFNLDDIGLEDSELFDDAGQEGDLDLVEESVQPESNEMLLYDYLLNTGHRKYRLGLNIPSGYTIYQFVRNRNFSKTKEKEIRDVAEGVLASAYGLSQFKDRYNYQVRKDGSLAVAYIDKDPPLLPLVNRVNDMTNGKVVIEDIFPDEAALTGLYRMNYKEAPGVVTGLIQFGAHRTRIIFFHGHDVINVTPVINEGTSDRNYLNTIFSKILFQLDSGEVTGLDRIILADNSEGEKVVQFFQKNFPEMIVENFSYNEDVFLFKERHRSKLDQFTTTIAIATHAAGFGKGRFPELSIIPEYVIDRQKIFKLEWHGICLLIAIGLTPIVFNYFYQANKSTIEQLQLDQTRYQTLISEVQPTVDQVNYYDEMMGVYREQLTLLGELVNGNIRWTTTLDHFNQAVNSVGGLWVTAMRETGDNIQIEGFSLYEDRIPALSRQFANVILTTVNRDQLRELDVFFFTMTISEVVEDDTLFTPESSRDIWQLLETYP